MSPLSKKERVAQSNGRISPSLSRRKIMALSNGSKSSPLDVTAVMTIRSVKILLVCNTDFFGKWLKLVSIWSVFWVKVSIFEKVPTHFSKCVFLDYRIFDKCNFIMQKWLKMTHFWPKNG